MTAKSGKLEGMLLVFTSADRCAIEIRAEIVKDLGDHVLAWVLSDEAYGFISKADIAFRPVGATWLLFEPGQDEGWSMPSP